MLFEKLKEMREYEAKTQKETAHLLHVTRSTYAGWETGKDIIPLRKLNDLANIYSVSLDYLVGLNPIFESRSNPIAIHEDILSENIKQIRKLNDLSQKDLAERINTSQSNIHKYETNKGIITTLYAIELSKKYQYPLEKLIQNNK